MPSHRVRRWLASLLLSSSFASRANADEADEFADAYVLFPTDEIFEPLIADLRWPRFSAAHQWRLGTDEFDRVASVSFGETFPFVQSSERPWGRWEFGLQAMLDAIFDLTAQSFDLSNEDYYVAVSGSIEAGRVTTQLRLSHTSSHLGDEYLIANGLVRQNVSFETIDVLASTDLFEDVRVYGGGGVVISTSPSVDPIVLQGGVEWTSPVSFWSGRLTPIVGSDLQLKQEDDWIPEVAVIAALRIADPANDVRRLELYARYYHGRSPDGQFFQQTIDSVGIGLRLDL